MKSPHIARIYDFGIDQQRLYVAMEYVEGCSLEALFQELAKGRGHVPLAQSLSIVVQVLSALEAAHTATVGGLAVPVLHRNLRASSILIGKNGSIKLGDFGVGRGPSDTVADDLRALGAILRQLSAGKRAGWNAMWHSPHSFLVGSWVTVAQRVWFVRSQLADRSIE